MEENTEDLTPQVEKAEDLEPKTNEFASDLEPHNLPVLIWPEDDKQLHERSATVTKFDRTIQQVAVDLFTTIRAHKAIGISAPQVGIKARIVALQLEDGRPMLLVNPKIVEVDDSTMFEWDEGCLSVPGYYLRQQRPAKVVVKYQDHVGDKHRAEFHGLYAFAVQHEIEHLDGKLFIDHISSLKKMMAKKKVKKELRKEMRNGKSLH